MIFKWTPEKRAQAPEGGARSWSSEGGLGAQEYFPKGRFGKAVPEVPRQGVPTGSRSGSTTAWPPACDPLKRSRFGCTHHPPHQ
jgi:hypothetical protein